MIIKINDLAQRCGYFYNAYIENDVICNSGYNCKHPWQKETYEEKGIKVGMCYCFSCPLGRMATEDDFKDKHTYEEGVYIIVEEECK